MTQPNLFSSQARDSFLKYAVEYLNTIDAKLDTDIQVPSPSGIIYTTKNSLLTSTYASQAFNEQETEFFYNAYDKLWEMGAYLEAYCLMRLVFGIMNKSVIDRLYRQGHLFTSHEIFNFAHKNSHH